jgi:hypothetical protein
MGIFQEDAVSPEVQWGLGFKVRSRKLIASTK